MTMLKSALDEKAYPIPTETLPLDTPEQIASSLVVVANLLFTGKIAPRTASVFGQLAREAISAHKAKFTQRLKELEEAHLATLSAQGREIKAERRGRKRKV